MLAGGFQVGKIVDRMIMRGSSDAESSSANCPAVFVVDDEPMLLELAMMLLEPEGYGVACFRDPGSALEAFRRAATKPKVLITDYSMQTMNGLELMKACRRIESDQKVLMVSGTVDASFIEQLPMLPDRFLEKPFRNHELISAVRKLLQEN